MIGHLRVLAMLLLGGAAQAAPTPPPPADFAGTQYIDGSGCVFTRSGADWTARQDGQGQALCGFPPSLDVRRTDPLTERALPLTQAPPPDVETMLLEQLSRDLRPGEWTADPAPAETRAEPAASRAPDPIHTALQDALTMAPTLREATGLSGSPELCARLGYKPDPSASAQGSTLGLCPGMRAATATASLTTGVTAAPPRPEPAAVRTAPAARPTVAATPRATTRRAASPTPAAPVAAAPKPVAVPGPEMIPASARYVQVGAYGDEGNAMIVLRALAARGYPTGQGRTRDGTKPLRLIMAGPFTDRQALIAALNDLRANGYPKAVAR